jgi:arginine/ornithine transport system permease protein
VEAARSIGMSRFQVYSRILLPSALRRALPTYSNEVIFMLHGTSLASIVTLMDLTGVARDVNSRFFAPFEAFILAAAFYLVMTFALVGLFHLAERRWLAYLRPRATPSH